MPFDKNGNLGLKYILSHFKQFKQILFSLLFSPPPLILPRGGGLFGKNEIHGLKVHFKSF